MNTFIVTTCRKVNRQITERAERAAKQLNAELIPRQDRSLEELQQERVRVWNRLYQTMKEKDSLSHRIEEIKEEQESIFDYAGQNEQTIAQLRKRLDQTKGLIAGIIVLFLAGYLVEYRWLKRRFMLFK